VVDDLLRHLDTVIVVDDGSGPEGRAACDAVNDRATVVRREANGGKGAAVKTGLAEAHQLGFTHALQVDADGQHDLNDVPFFVETATAAPMALVLGSPAFDDSAPRGRRIGRTITNFWVRVEAGDVIDDAMCGYRVYPVEAALAANARGDAMDFDPEIAVRLAWAGLPIINLPTKVRYLHEDAGGVSHFRLLHDNLLISALHFRLASQRVWRLFWDRVLGRQLPPMFRGRRS
jgi:glycosyltransferase involved in cell wall biosynthesis